MSDDGEVPTRGLSGLLASAGFARAFTLAAFGAVFGALLIERLAGLVTIGTIIAGLCVVGVGMLVARRRELSPLRIAPTTLVIFVVWAGISIAWAEDPAATAGGWLSLVGIGVLAVVIAHVRDTLQAVRALGDVLRCLLTISLGIEILSGILLDVPFAFLGVQGRLADLGPIQGIWGTRNVLGFVAVIALITFIVEFRTLSIRVGLAIYSVALAGLLAALSGSPVAVVVAAAVALATGALALVRHAPRSRRPLLQAALGGVVVVVVLVLTFARDTVISALGARGDLAMRTELWSDMLWFVRFRPVQGWGWSGPWTPDIFPFNALNFGLDQNHGSGLNAYLDVLMQLGWVGLLVFLAFAGVALGRSWLVATARRSVVHAWTPLMLIALLTVSLFESFTLFGFGWLLLVLCGVRAGQSRSWRELIGAPAPRDG